MRISSDICKAVRYANTGRFKSVEKSDGSGTIKSEGMHRNNKNTGAFAHLEERMSKKHIRELAKEFSIDMDGITLVIDGKEELLNIMFAGETNPDDVGQIIFFPNVFRTKEELLRTLFHEKLHVLQYKEYRAE